MIISLLSPSLRPVRTTACFTALLVAAGVGAFSPVRAAVPTVAPNDTFTIELYGYNLADPTGNFSAIQPDLDPTFGTTQTYTGDAPNGQVLTVTSSQTISGNTFTDVIKLSVPTTFLPAGEKDNNNNTIDAFEFSIGDYNTSTGAPGDPLNFTSALSGITITGAATYTFNGKAGTLSVPNNKQDPKYASGNTAFSDLYSVNTPNGTDIGAYNVNSFTLTITNAVPEPSTTGAVLLGAGGLIGLLAVRRRQAHA